MNGVALHTSEFFGYDVSGQFYAFYATEPNVKHSSLTFWLGLVLFALLNCFLEDWGIILRTESNFVWVDDTLLYWMWLKSLYRSHTGSHFYGTEYEIWTDFWPVGNTLKKFGPNMSNFWGWFFHVFMGKKNLSFF